MTDLAASVIEQFRNKMIVECPTMIRECLDLLSDEQVWWRPNASSNAVGNLVLHLCGATRHFWGRGVGGLAYQRDREAEFTTRGPIPKAELRRQLDQAVDEAERILDGLEASRLLEVADRGGATLSVLATLSRMSHHWSFHTGQIVFATKLLREGAVTDLMRRVMVR